MEPEETKSTQKNSSRQSEHKKKRPSLFPIRNSARRKSSMCESYNVFDPHSAEHKSSNQGPKNNDDDQLNCRECKSETQFEYKTPSAMSGYSSPRTTRSSPKQFIVDTPFVPFVHQSLSKTVWQSEEIIPEEKDDIDRKQSQTQIPRNVESYDPINEQKQPEQTPPPSQQEELANTYPDLPQIAYDQNEGKSRVGSLQQCGAISISVPGEEKVLEVTQVNEDENKNQVNQLVLKEETYDESNVAGEYQIRNQIEHNEYVSKAPIYYKEAKKQIAQQSGCIYVEEKEDRRPNLSYSYIECVSIRPTWKSVEEGAQQTSPRRLSGCRMQQIRIGQKQKHSQHTEMEKIKLQICNHSSDQIKSTKKLNSHSQTSIAERLKHISQSYQQKIGMPREQAHFGLQASVRTHNYAQQTPPQHQKLSIHDQVSFSITHNYGQRFEEKIEHLQNYIKNLYETKQAEIRDLRNRKSVDKQINTQTMQSHQPSGSNQKKHINKKSIRNFSTQYDPKDFGQNRSSLKRVSIADTKIIYEIDDSLNSTETFQEKKSSKRQGKEKEKEKEKEKGKVKLESRSEEQEPESEVEQVKKSKRKASKTPKKKKAKH